MLEKSLDITRITRQNFVALIEGLSLEQLNKVPAGFNNNIIWNFGHIIVSQQMLCYLRGGLDIHLPELLVKKYGRDSKPEAPVTLEEVEHLKHLAFHLIELLEQDLKQNKFDNYQPFTTHFGVALQNIEEAVEFSATHDCLHLGYAMALRKASHNN